MKQPKRTPKTRAKPRTRKVDPVHAFSATIAEAMGLPMDAAPFELREAIRNARCDLEAAVSASGPLTLESCARRARFELHDEATFRDTIARALDLAPDQRGPLAVSAIVKALVERDRLKQRGARIEYEQIAAGLRGLLSDNAHVTPTRYSMRYTRGSHPIASIKALREALDLPLKEAKDLWDRAALGPIEILSHKAMASLERAKETIGHSELAGTCTIEPSIEPTLEYVMDLIEQIRAAQTKTRELLEETHHAASAATNQASSIMWGFVSCRQEQPGLCEFDGKHEWPTEDEARAALHGYCQQHGHEPDDFITVRVITWRSAPTPEQP